MSARAEELLAALSNDEDLQAKMAAATTDAERRQLFADAGYSDVSATDLRAAANPSGELSEDELDAAAGAGAFTANIGSYSVIEEGPIIGIDLT